MNHENKKHMILIVDDNPSNLRLLELILTKENYEVISVESASKALKFIETSLPDLIFLDVMMPDLDGYELCDKLKNLQRTSDIPIIFVTSKSDTNDIVRGFECGAADYVTKPFNRVELLARLKTHLELKQTHDRLLALEKKSVTDAITTTTNHEINQPLTVLTGNLFLLKNSLANMSLAEDQHKYMQLMESSINKIKDLLVKYRNGQPARYEKYSSDAKMLIFDEKKKSE